LHDYGSLKAFADVICYSLYSAYGHPDGFADAHPYSVVQDRDIRQHQPLGSSITSIPYPIISFNYMRKHRWILMSQKLAQFLQTRFKETTESQKVNNDGLENKNNIHFH